MDYFERSPQEVILKDTHKVIFSVSLEKTVVIHSELLKSFLMCCVEEQTKR